MKCCLFWSPLCKKILQCSPTVREKEVKSFSGAYAKWAKKNRFFSFRSSSNCCRSDVTRRLFPPNYTHAVLVCLSHGLDKSSWSSSWRTRSWRRGRGGGSQAYTFAIVLFVVNLQSCVGHAWYLSNSWNNKMVKRDEWFTPSKPRMMCIQ